MPDAEDNPLQNILIGNGSCRSCYASICEWIQDFENGISEWLPVRNLSDAMKEYAKIQWGCVFSLLFLCFGDAHI